MGSQFSGFGFGVYVQSDRGSRALAPILIVMAGGRCRILLPTDRPISLGVRRRCPLSATAAATRRRRIRRFYSAHRRWARSVAGLASIIARTWSRTPARSRLYDKIELARSANMFRCAACSAISSIASSRASAIFAGDRQPSSTSRPRSLAVLICTKASSRSLADGGQSGADLLSTSPTTRGMESSAPYQLLAMAAMRSVETHTPMVRVANTGISTVILPDGKITARTDLFAPRNGSRAHTGEEPGRTIYCIVGDLFAEIFFGLMIIAVAWAEIAHAAAIPGGIAVLFQIDFRQRPQQIRRIAPSAPFGDRLGHPRP